MYKSNGFWKMILLLTVIGSFSFHSHSQDNGLRPVSTKYAIKNTTIIQSPDKTISNGTVLFENGIIKAVGPNVSIPADAIIIDGDSLYVYSGFIAGVSNLGIPEKKEERPKDDPKTKQSPTYERAGITPETSVVDHIDPNDKSIDQFRKLGFTASGIVPKKGMIPGTSGVFLLDGKTSQDMLLKNNASMYSQLAGAEGVYPNTVIAVIAKYRELYRQAQEALKYKKLYASSSNNMERYTVDETLEALFPVVSGELSVTFQAQSILDIMRVLSLKKELGFGLVLADVQQGWDATSEIKKGGVSAFLSLDLPEDPADKKKDKKKEEKEGKEKLENDQDTEEDENTEESEKEEEEEAKVKTAADLEKEALEKRQMEQRAKYYSQSSTFKKAGIQFGYSLLNLKDKDFKPAMKKIIDNGLSERDLLAALTIDAAQILGVSAQMGTIEKGKIANLVVTDQPYFGEKSNVQYVFIDGVQFKYDSEKKTEKKDTKKSDQ